MKTEFIDLAHRGGDAGREDTQWGWYGSFKEFFVDKTLLDVGTGVSKIKDRVKEFGWNTKVTTHEACKDVAADIYGDLTQLATGSFQTVTCFDVIEHVKEYGRLVFNMARIATETLVITTPGVQLAKCGNPYHWHEFETDELCQLIEATGMIFIKAFGAEWKNYPFEPYPTREISYTEMRSNVTIHPIAVAYRK